jgi:hypothetical protein
VNKCVSCGLELPPQTRFCGDCGTVQPTGTNVDNAGNLETISSTPRVENTPSSVPPPPPQQIGGVHNASVEFPPFGSADNRPNINIASGQANNPSSGGPPQLPPQPQTFYGDNQQPYANYQQPYGDYAQPQQPYGSYQQNPPSQQQPYGSYQPDPPSQQPYGGYQQNPPSQQQPYGGYQQNPPSQLPYGGYQQNPPSQQQPYGGYQQNPPSQLPYSNYQQTTETTPNAGQMGTTPTGLGVQPKAPAWRKWAIIAIVVVLILGASGILLRFLPTTLTPTISVTSTYQDGGTPAAADGTDIHVKGKNFAANSAVSFLLDSMPVTGSAQSDAKGNIAVDLTVATSWTTGRHTLTASDANKNTTATGVTLKIVQPGEASTPGPYGAPANNATFSVEVNAQMQDDADKTHYASHFTLNITGHPDPNGGTVCSPGDDRSPQETSIPDVSADGTTYAEVSTYTCSGTYQAGKITYNETLQTRTISATSGASCTLNKPLSSYTQVTGTYNSQKEFSGTVTFSSIPVTQFTCKDLEYTPASATGTWTGTASTS